MADITKGDESETARKVDNESRKMQVVQAEVHRNPENSNILKVDVDTGDSEKEGRSTPQGTDEEDQPVVDFEDQAYELAQA